MSLVRRFALVMLVFLIAGVSHWRSRVEAQPGPAVPPAAAGGKFEFSVVESYDARYLGDTPGHTGRHGELGELRPGVALGDPVFRGETKVGTVSGLRWSSAHGSLEIEFDPEPRARIAVGEVVWVRLGSSG